MNFLNAIPDRYINAILILFIMTGLTLFLTRAVGNNAFDYEEIMITAMLLAGIVTVLLGEEGIRLGMVVWVGLFILGFRTIYVTSHLRIHPLTILIIVMSILLFIQYDLFQRRGFSFRLHPLHIGLLFFVAWGAYRGILNDVRRDSMAMVVINLVLSVPIYYITWFVIRTENYKKALVVTMIFAGAFIGLLGTLERLFPGLSRIFPGFIGSIEVLEDSNGFRRSTFEFWGQPAAAFICGLALPMIIPAWQWFSNIFLRLILVVAAGLMLFAVYISGYRSLWAVVMAVIVMVGILRRDIRWLAGIAIAGAILLAIAPPEARARFLTFTSAVSGEVEDSSAEARSERLDYAIEGMLDDPLGMGWTAAGWVHNDFLQIAADASPVAGIVFASWYAYLLIRISLRALITRDNLAVGLAGAVLISGGLLFTHPFVFLTQLIAPVWFVWALTEYQFANNSDDSKQHQPVRAG